jgi:DNA-binding LacI/PurR family transcriptional regulator
VLYFLILTFIIAAMKSGLSLHDVARAAGVSHTTVSNVLNRPGYDRVVAALTRDRVRNAADQLGFVPHQAARSLRLGRTHEIVFATPASLRYAYVHDLIEELQGALAGQHYRLDLELFRQVREVPALYRTFTKGRCDGVILYGIYPEHRGAIESMQKRGMPVVVINALDGLAVDTVDYDHSESARLGTAHLLERGHTRVAIIVHDRGFAQDGQRLRGYRRALEKAGGPFDESLILNCQVGADLLPLWQRITSSTPPPTGIICYNAEMSAQLLGVMRRQGVRVPAEMALVSLGDAQVNTLVEVPLTAVDSNPRGIAAAVVERLLARIARPHAPPQHILVQPFLVERESS